MAYVTRRSSGGWSTVSNYSSYANVVSNYAAALSQAATAQKSTELNSKILEYKNGNLAYTDLVNYINSRISGALAGSGEEVDLRSTLYDVQNYENSQQIKIKRSQLEAKYAKNGVSAEERLAIEKEMLGLYKAGTAEYTEQLNTIATATELATQEKKNAKLATLQAELSKGGLTTKEKIEYTKQARDLTEKGSEERALADQKIAELEEQKKSEDLNMKALKIQSDFYDKAKEGGISNEEELQLNRQLQSVFPEGSEESVKLKADEATILGNIANEARAGSGKAQKALEEAAATEFIAMEEKIKMLQDKPENADTVKQINDLLNQQNQIASNLGDALSPSQKGELKARMEQVQTLQNQIDTGQVVTVKGTSTQGGIPVTTQKLVPISELQNYSQDSEVYYGTDAKGNPITDQTGKAAAKKIVTIVDENGQEKDVAIGENGNLEELAVAQNKEGDAYYYTTGKVIQYGTQMQSKMKAEAAAKEAAVAAEAARQTQMMSIPTPTATKTSSSSNKTNSNKSSNKSSKSSSTTMKSTPTVMKSTPTVTTKASTPVSSIKISSGLSSGSSGSSSAGGGGGGGSWGGSSSSSSSLSSKVSSVVNKVKSSVSSLLSKLFK